MVMTLHIVKIMPVMILIPTRKFCWHYDDDDITEIGYLPEGVYIRAIEKKFMSGLYNTLFVIFIITSILIASRSVFLSKLLTCPKFII